MKIEYLHTEMPTKCPHCGSKRRKKNKISVYACGYAARLGWRTLRNVNPKRRQYTIMEIKCCGRNKATKDSESRG